MSHILRYSEYIPEELLDTSDTLITELADEARHYLALLEKLRAASSDSEREDLEAELYASISHFRSHSEITLECLDALVGHLPDDPEDEDEEQVKV